jgi:CRP/FNR family transcriptional regulator, dissimilatory nitrate respiration regulator
MDIDDWLPRSNRVSAIERRLAAGQALFNQCDLASGIYEVVSGKVRLTRVDAEGRELLLGIACAGDTFAEASLFSLVHGFSAVAMSKVVLRFYPKASLLAGFARNPQAAQAFAALLARQVMDLRTRLERHNLHSARDRVRHYLSGAEDGTVVLPGTVKDLAGELGLSHEALYRTLSEMEDEGEIARRKGSIRLACPGHAAIPEERDAAR